MVADGLGWINVPKGAWKKREGEIGAALLCNWHGGEMVVKWRWKMQRENEQAIEDLRGGPSTLCTCIY